MNKKLTSLWLLLLAVFAAPAKNANVLSPRWGVSDGTPLWGIVVSSDNWGWFSSNYGVYSFNSQMNGALEEVHLDDAMNANFGGTINDQTLYFTSQYYDSSFQTHCSFFVYDINTWEQLANIETEDKSFMASDMTADPTTGYIYGCFYNQEGTAFELAKINPRTYERTVVSTTCFEGQERACGLAFNATGELYSIALNGNLYKVDKATGEKTLIGSTDITPDTSIQSAAFDFTTGKLYWACTSDDETMLCEVDTTDGAATTLGEFPAGEHVTTLYVPGGEAPQGAPAKAGDVVWNFEGGSLSGSVSFTVPTVTFGGEALSGAVTYTVYVNDEQVATGTAQAGAEATANVTVQQAGMNKLDLVLSNEAGRSESARQRLWVGNDVPKAPQNVTLAISDSGLATISWEAPTEGIHGGYINTQALVYDVYRAANGKRVANHVSETTVTDQITSAAITPYSYKVVAYVDEEASEEAESNTVTWGQGYEIPYSEDFSSQDNFNLFTIVDANEDGQTWYYQKSSWGGNSAAIDLSGDEDDFVNDDWLITPRISLKADRNYLLKFKATISASNVSNSDDPVELYIGQSLDVASATRLTTEPIAKGYTTEQQAIVEVGEDGIYYVMFRMVKTATYGNFRLNNLSIDVNEIFSAPAEVEQLSVVAGAEGANYVDIAFNAPTKNIDGSSTEALAKIEVSRDGEVVKTFETPTPGEALSYKDQSLKEGNHTYTVTPYDAESKGRETSQTVYVGFDATTAVQNVKVVDNVTDITITWDAPTTSINGGYVDYENLTYDIIYYTGSSWNPTAVEVVSDLEQTSYTFDPGMTGQQSVRQYVIRTFSDGGYGQEATTRNVILGARYELPFQESFPKGKAQQDFWWQESASNWLEFTGNTSLSADGDGGCMGIHLGYSDKRISASYNSGKINISTVANPTLTFKYYYTEEMTGSWTVGIENAEGEVKQAFTVDLDNLDAAEGWQMGVVNLNDYKDDKFVVLRFEAATNDKCTTTDLYLDDIRVMNQLENDLQVTAQIGETAVNGAQSIVKATVTNVGATAREGFTVNLVIDGEVVASEAGQTLGAGQSKTYTMTYTPSIFAQGSLLVYVAVENEGDDDPANNETEPVSVELTANTLPTVALEGSAVEGVATLSWTAPETAGGGKTEEGFEDYAANTLDTSFGGWLAVDVDEWDVGGSDSGMIPGDYEDTGTFLVFNPAEALGEDYLDDDDYADYEPFEGEQYVICHGVYYDDEQTDDWLISPELSGKAQTVVFYARGFSYEEDMQVLYSTTDRNVESFSGNVVFDQEVTTQWKRYTVKLPQGAKYFAFRMTTYGGDILGIDGVEYESALDGLEATGYNVYRDGQLVAQTSADTFSFADTEAESGDHTYVVSAQYGSTESMPSNEVVIGVTTAISSTLAEGRTSVRSYGLGGTAGVPVGRGVYIVTSNGKTRKQIVR